MLNYYKLINKSNIYLMKLCGLWHKMIFYYMKYKTENLSMKKRKNNKLNLKIKIKFFKKKLKSYLILINKFKIFKKNKKTNY